MAELPEALGDALRARYSLAPRSPAREPKRPVTHGQGLRARMNRILAKFGGNRRAAAKATGIPYSTWGHLAGGKRKPSAKNLAKVGAAFGRIVTAPALAALVKARGYPSQISIKAVVVADPGAPPDPATGRVPRGKGGSRYINGREAGASRADVKNITTGPEYRTFKAEELSAGDVKGVVDAWVAGGDDAATRELLGAVKERYEEFGFEGDNVKVILDD